jgi:DNA-binding MarR family transcriptional regulator
MNLQATREPDASAGETGPESSGSLLETLVGYAVRRANNRIMTDLSPTLADVGLRPVTFSILATIQAQPGVIQSGVGAMLAIQRANLVPLLNELAAAGLIERRPAPRDSRAQALYLTPVGEKALQEASDKVREHEDRMLRRLDASDRRTLIKLLRKVGT